MNREEMLLAATRGEPWDIVIIGGGASGVGCAVDAASRGYSVLLLEQSDFGKGTSSRSTKLVHGGVRYLEQGNISLVMEALKERGILKQNAPHLVSELAFVVPNYEWWEMPFYGVGLKVYDLLSMKYRFGRSQILSKEETLERLPTIREEGLRGGVVYFDGQFDDTRLLINLVQTAAENGATVLNYARVYGIVKDADGIVSGVQFTDEETGQIHLAKARAVINATGAFCDEVRKLSDPSAQKLVSPSQGIHLVFDGSFLSTDYAIMIPHTSDGRVMFAIPWHGHTVVGTTDTPIDSPDLEPRALEEEIEFILTTAQKYLDKPPTHEDILSVFAGIRPLVKAGGGKSTAALSRDHTIHIDNSGLMTLTGGKWTTYRHMAEDCIDQAAILAKLPESACKTSDLKIHGYHENPETLGGLAVYGADAGSIRQIPGMANRLHERLPYTEAEVIWAIRNEMARTVEDVLARRTRALFLDAYAAIESAPKVADMIADELGHSEDWRKQQVISFTELARSYLPVSS